MSHLTTPIKSLHQLPVITQKPFKSTFPIIDKMQTLHTANIKTIRKQQQESQIKIQKYNMNKSQYFQTVHKHKQQNAQKALKSLQNKSTLLSKQNSQKSKKHHQLYSSFMTLTKQKLKTNYLKQKAKIQSAWERKQKFDQSRTKHVFINRPNYHKMYLEELGKSQELQRTTVHRLMQAQTRRKQILQEKQNLTKGKLQRLIFHAQTFVHKTSQQRQQKYIEKSVKKLRQSEKLISEFRQRSRSHSQTSRKSSQQKFMKAQSTRQLKQREMIEKLENMLQEKSKKIQTINERRGKNLEMLATTLKISRSQHMEEAQKKSRLIMIQADMKNQEILQETQQKWKFLTSLRTQFNKIKNNNLYDSQQVSLRY